MSKKVELNVKAMLENGAIAVGALAEGRNHVMAILCDKAHEETFYLIQKNLFLF